jgi:hypothetical protein
MPKGQSIYKCLVDNSFRVNRIEQLTFWVRIRLRRGVFDTPLSDKVCQWFAASQWFFSGYIGFLHQWNWQSPTHSLYFLFNCGSVSVQIAKLKPKNIYDRSVVFSGYWPTRYFWNIVESGVKHHKPTKPTIIQQNL